jgi:cytochrome c553
MPLRAVVWASLMVIASSEAAAQQLQGAATFTVPAWAFPGIAPELVSKPPYDSVEQLRVPHSGQVFTLARVKDAFNVADWHPNTHPATPNIVAHGRKPATLSCGYCHLPDGQGRAENALLAGLPAEYFARQVADFRSGARKSAIESWAPSAAMHAVAVNVTDAETEAAARYFASMRAKRRYTVVESARVPRTLEAGGLYAARGGGESEPIDDRIIEITTDLRRHELRDAGETFIAYVPPGSIARGRKIATTSATIPPTSCVTCHGPTLRGVGVVPPLAGRSPSYILRQLIGFKTGARATTASVPMQGVVAPLTLDDMIAVAAYAGSLKP